MGIWISYTLVSGIILLGLYLAYSWAMAGENQPRFNRAVLSGCYILAAVLPLIDIHLNSTTETNTGIINVEMPGIIAITGIADHPSAPLWYWIVAATYITGATAVAIMTFIALARLHRMVKHACKVPYRGYMIAIVDDTMIAPFSWFRYIVMNKDDYRDYRELILTHEIAHLERYHRLDLLIARIFEILMWYNPAAWLMTSSLRAVHEFEADRAVINRIDNQHDYQMLLIKKAVGRSFPVLANSLNHSNLKKRITMMLNPISSKSRRVRVIALVPAAVAALLCINLPFVARAIDSVSAIDITIAGDSKGTQNTLNPQPVADEPVKKENQTESKTETRITVNGKPDNNVRIFVNGKEYTNDINSINPDSIKSVSVMKDRDEIHIDMYRPGETIPPRKATSKSDKKQGLDNIVVVSAGTIKKGDPDGKPVFSSVEEMPQFPGGETALLEFLRDNIRYPESEINNTGRHKVIVKFVIGPDGSVNDAEIIKGAAEAFNNEALRVVGTLPKYIPGKVNGKPVSVYYTLPIVFSTKGTTDDQTK